jgi:hypothetical protein
MPNTMTSIVATITFFIVSSNFLDLMFVVSPLICKTSGFEAPKTIQIFTLRNRSALPMTETELKLMAGSLRNE